MKNIIAILIIGLLAAGCIKTRSEVDDVEEKKAMQTQVVSMQRAQADREAQIQNYETQIRALNGRIETLEHKADLAEQNNLETKKLNAALEERVKALEQAALQTEQELASVKSRKVEAATTEGGRSVFDEAEEQFKLKNWKKAANLYVKFREANPNDKLNSIATLRIALCFAELGMKNESRLFLEETVEKYPGTKSAKLAKQKLTEIGKKKKSNDSKSPGN